MTARRARVRKRLPKPISLTQHTWGSILVGDAMTVLDQLPEASVHCVVTSPPYYNLRSYLPADHPDKAAEIGLEDDVEAYIQRIVLLFRKMRRAMRPDSSAWVNLGDSWSGSGVNDGTKNPGLSKAAERSGPEQRAWAKRKSGQAKGIHLPPKNLIGIPWRVALALQADGWTLRDCIIWEKPNPMPSSAIDRTTCSHEYIFLLTPSRHYFYDWVAIMEPSQGRHYPTWEERKAEGAPPRHGDPAASGDVNKWRGIGGHPAGRNKHSVWSIPTQGYAGAHFATMPPKVAEPCILAGTSAGGCCPDCGTPWTRMVDVTYDNPGNRSTNGPRSLEQRHETAGYEVRLEKRIQTTGWEPGCSCGRPWEDNEPCIVLDPFAGAGTTGLVASRINRTSDPGLQFWGIELNPDSAADAVRRINEDQPGADRQLANGKTQLGMFEGVT